MEDVYSYYRLVIYVILGPIVSILGILGNILLLLALWHRSHKSGQQVSNNSNNHGMLDYMHVFICGLALADICYLAFNLQACYIGSSNDIVENESLSVYIYQIQQPTWNALKATSDFIVILMTLDRCRKIGNIAAMRLQFLRVDDDREKSRSVYMQLLGATAMSFTMHLPYYFQVDQTFYQECDNNNEVDLDLTTEETPPHCAASSEDLWLLYNILYVAMMKVLPVVVVVTANVVLFKRMKIIWRRRRTIKDVTMTTVHRTEVGAEANNRRRSRWSVTNMRSVKEQKMATVLVTIAIAFVILTLPANIAFIVYSLKKVQTSQGSEDATPYFIVTNFLESVNYALNFYIYCAVHKEIRDSFLDMFKAVVNTVTCGRHCSSSGTSVAAASVRTRSGTDVT
jgi:hypothetical protein